MNYSVHTFANGLRAIHLPLDSQVSYCGFGIKVGARNEKAEEFGLAHFVEHMLFKGTEKRKAWHILNRMENVGGELNAFTSKEETFVYSVFPAEYFHRAYELLLDIVFNSKFPQNEIEKETEVILDEINSYKDNPSELIFDEFENILFRNHALGHNILGDETTLTHFNTELAISFTRQWYHPANMIFFSMGNIPFSRIIRMLEDVPDRTVMTPPLCQKPLLETFTGGYERINRNTYQAHVIIGGRSYGMFENISKRTSLMLLNNLLGGPGMNSRLNLSLREKNGLAYSVESNVTTYTDTGMASIYFGTHAKSVERALSLVQKELEKLRFVKLTDLQLSAIKKQLTGQMRVGLENRENLFLHAGKYFLHHNSYYTLADRIGRIEKVSGEEILAAANEIFSPDDLFTLVYE